MKAVDKFDYRLGNRFSTYAVWWIRRAIVRAIVDRGRTIGVPGHVAEAINNILRAANRLRKRFGYEPSVNEIAEELKTPSSYILLILEASKEPVSLDAGMSHKEDLSLNDLLENKHSALPQESIMESSLHNLIHSALLCLSPREQEIMRMRYGLNEAAREFTLQECGDKLSITRQRVLQIEEKAFKKLRS